VKEALFYQAENGRVHCRLCPHECMISEGQRGSCRVRKNDGGKLYAENYGLICSSHFDPVEKKPLYHFFPGSVIFSVGSIGCNLHCKFCQNWEISQSGTEEYNYLRRVSPPEMLGKALAREENIGIAYTYNEPAVWIEFMIETAELVAREGLKNVMVTNGYINPEPLNRLLPLIDAFSVDLKGFTGSFYKTYTSSKLDPVLENLKTIRRSGKHLEITNLVINGVNDDEKEFKAMSSWIAGELGEDTVFHISRYFPMYKMTTEATPVEKLLSLHRIASGKLKYVYLGNLRTGEGQVTFCKKCGNEAIIRSGYHTQITGLDENGHCLNCHSLIIEHLKK
jgi:pyruvate formate lyase activating enzyme